MRFEHFIRVSAAECNDISKIRLNPSISKINIFTKIAKDFLLFHDYKEHDVVPLKDSTNLDAFLSCYLDYILRFENSQETFLLRFNPTSIPHDCNS